MRENNLNDTEALRRVEACVLKAAPRLPIVESMLDEDVEVPQCAE